MNNWLDEPGTLKEVEKLLESRRRSSVRWSREGLGDELLWLRPDDEGVFDLLPRPLWVVGGAFDLLHSGHMRLIHTARRLAGRRGSVLVALDSDQKISLGKGVGRPVMSWPERAAALGWLPVDAVVEIQNRRDMDRFIMAVRPEGRVVGEEYAVGGHYPEVPKVLVRSGGLHTSVLIDRIVNRFKQTYPVHSSIDRGEGDLRPAVGRTDPTEEGNTPPSPREGGE